VNQRIGHLTLLKKSLGKILMGRAIVGSKIHGCLEQRNRVVQFAFSQKDNTEVIFSNVVV